MLTVVIPEKQYETLRKQASLYKEVLSGIRGSIIEQYSERRIEEFLKGDKVSKKVKEKMKQLLK